MIVDESAERQKGNQGLTASAVLEDYSRVMQSLEEICLNHRATGSHKCLTTDSNPATCVAGVATGRENSQLVKWSPRSCPWFTWSPRSCPGFT